VEKMLLHKRFPISGKRIIFILFAQRTLKQPHDAETVNVHPHTDSTKVLKEFRLNFVLSKENYIIMNPIKENEHGK
jgi:hypothetical protein